MIIKQKKLKEGVHNGNVEGQKKLATENNGGYQHYFGVSEKVGVISNITFSNVLNTGRYIQNVGARVA